MQGGAPAHNQREHLVPDMQTHTPISVREKSLQNTALQKYHERKTETKALVPLKHKERQGNKVIYRLVCLAFGA